MSSNTIYYVYAYLRSKDSKTAKAGTPYYIGKGCGSRAFNKHRVPVPTDRSFIKFLEQNLSEIGALAIERRLIEYWGRKDLNSGILLNRTPGGEEGPNNKGRVMTVESNAKRSKALIGKSKSDETRAKMSAAQQGKVVTEETKDKLREKRKLQVMKPVSEETRAKSSATQKGISVPSRGNGNGPLSDRTKKKLSEANKGKKQSEETLQKKREAVERRRALGLKNNPQSEETKQKKRQNRKPTSEETKEKIRIARAKQVMKPRRPMSEESKRKMSATNALKKEQKR